MRHYTLAKTINLDPVLICYRIQYELSLQLFLLRYVHSQYSAVIQSMQTTNDWLSQFSIYLFC